MASCVYKSSECFVFKNDFDFAALLSTVEIKKNVNGDLEFEVHHHFLNIIWSVIWDMLSSKP